MALFLVRTDKATQEFGGRKWCNRYFVDASDASAALALAREIWLTAERPFHETLVYCYQVYANLQGDPPFSVGEILPIDVDEQRGLLTTTGRGELLPDFCAVRVDFPVPGSRPSRKFYKPLLREGDVVGNNLAGAALQTALAGVLGVFEGIGIVDVDGELWRGNGINRGVTSKRFGREAALSVPPAPIPA